MSRLFRNIDTRTISALRPLGRNEAKQSLSVWKYAGARWTPLPARASGREIFDRERHFRMLREASREHAEVGLGPFVPRDDEGAEGEQADGERRGVERELELGG